MRALVTAANSRMAYVVTKALLRKGVEVVVADFIPRSFCFYSRYVGKHFIYPSPYTDQDSFICCLVDKVREYKCDVLIPIMEETFLISKRMGEFSGKVGIACPSYEQIVAVHSKDRLSTLCTELDIPVPRTRILKTVAETDEICRDLRFPVILKPRQGGGNFGIEHMKEPETFSRQYAAYLQRYGFSPERVLVQEYIDVEKKFSQSFVYNKGQMVAGFADIHWRDYPARGGAGTYRESVHRPDIERLGKRLMDHLAWHGVAECEFVEERNTGNLYIIEINPRIWGGINSAVSAGLNVPWILYCLASGNEDRVDSVSYRDLSKTRWFWGDAQVFFDYLMKSDRKAEFVFKFFNMFSSEVVFDDFDRYDPLPFLVWPTRKLMQLVKYRSFKPPSYGISGEWE